MKKILLLITFIHVITVQSQSYSLTVLSNTYTNLTGNTSLNNGTVWDDPAYTFPIGFNFQLYSTIFNTAYIHPDGSGGVVTATLNTANTMPTLIPFSTDIIDRGFNSGTSLSTISYKLEGSVSNRILKIEWKNVGFFNDLNVNNTSTDFANFQVWLYETTNVVEYRFGPSNVSNPAISFEGDSGPAVAMFPLVNFTTGEIVSPGIVLSGSPSAPTVNNTVNQLFLNGMPANGTTYRFTSSAFSIDEFDKANAIKIYPNPTNDFLLIENNNVDNAIQNIEIIDSTGKMVKNESSSLQKINVYDLNSGLYIIKFQTDLGIIRRKFIKK